MKINIRNTLFAVLLLTVTGTKSFAQWSDGPFLSIGAMGGSPVSKPFNDYSWGLGGTGKFSLPLNTNDYFTVSAVAISFNGKKNGKNMKERDLLSAYVGYRYDFRREDAYGYLYMEPQIGWMLVGTDYNTFTFMPSVGYSMNSKVDLSLWYMGTTSRFKLAKISAIGLTLAYNFHFAKPID